LVGLLSCNKWRTEKT